MNRGDSSGAATTKTVESPHAQDCLIDGVEIRTDILLVGPGMLELAACRQPVLAPISILGVHKPHIREASRRFVVLGPAASSADNDIVVEGIRREAVMENRVEGS